MADTIDDANEDVMQFANMTEQAIRSRPMEAEATGFCLYCSETVSDRRWCDGDCRDGWERERRRLK